MVTPLSLSPGLRRRLQAVAWRVRLLRGLRALSRLVLVLVVSGTAALLIDHQVPLPPQVRQGLLAAWVGLAGIGLVGALAALARRITPQAVAARIEKYYPELGERLTSAVELSAAPAAAHGAPAFIALLLEEAEEQSRELHFPRAVPARRTTVLSALAAVAVLLAVSPAFVWPAEYERLRSRFLHPWDEAEPVADDATPEPPPSKPRPRPVPRVELAPESPAITVTPPAYARHAIEERTLHGLVDVPALQHSEVCFDFAFTRPARAARLEWRQEGKPPRISVQELKRSSDRRRATGTRPADAPASYRLVVEGEEGGRLELPGGKLIVKPDQPPTFVSVEAGQNLPYVVAHDRLPLAVTVRDDIGVAKVELEYRQEDGPIAREIVALRGAGTRQAQGRHLFALAGKVQGRQHLYYRFRAEDNLPAKLGGPHVVTYPADGWLMLRVADEGQTSRQKQIADERDELRRQLARLKDNLASEQRGIYRVDRETADSDRLTAEQKQRLEQLRRDNQEAWRALEKLSEQADKVPALQDLADQAGEAARGPLQASQKALDRAAEQEAEQRHESLRKADEEVGKALDQLDELRKRNEKLAEERLRQAKVEALADREKRLAEELRKLAEKDRGNEDRLEQLRREQARTSRELQQLTRQDRRLRPESEESTPEKARELAERAGELARRQRDLARSQDAGADGKGEPAGSRQSNPAGEMVRRQQEMARQGEDLARQVEREQGEQAPATEQARKVEQALRQAARQMQAGALPDAQKSGEEAAQQLRRLADRLARSRPGEGDPQTADALQQARQLEQRQAEQNRRMQPLAGRGDVRKAQQRQEQNDLRQQAKQLARELDRQAEEAPGRAGSALEQASRQADRAEQAMRQAQAQPHERGAMQERAAQLLEQAMRQAQQAAGREAKGKPSEAQPGKAIRQAQQHMEQADRMLDREQPADAAPQAQQAARALQEAARQMAQAAQSRPGSMRPGGPGGETPPSDRTAATPPGGRPESRPMQRPLSAPGRAWGELPGELRTRIMQEMKAQYGDDYARRIKLYFEQIADSPSR